MPSIFPQTDQVSLSSKPADGESGDSLVLLARAQKGDAESFGELCRLHEARLLRQAMLLCPESAEDLVQECLLGAWKSIGNYRGGCQFFTWLCAIMLNQHRNLRRRKWPVLLSNLFKSSDAFHEIVDSTRPPDEIAEASDEAILVQCCLRRLSPKHREVIHLRFYVDDSLEGIASALGCSIGTVKSRLFHALENLRRMTEAEKRRTE